MDNRALVNCYYCGDDIWFMDCTWVDQSFGDCCSGNDEGENDNGVHTPVEVKVD